MTIKIVIVICIFILLSCASVQTEHQKFNINNTGIEREQHLTFTISIYDIFKYLFYYIRGFCGL